MPAPLGSSKQLFPGIGLTMVMLLASTSVFAQTALDPTGRSGEPLGPLKEEFQRPKPPPSPVLPIVPLTPETGVPTQPGTVQVFVRDVNVIGNTAFSDKEIAEVTTPFKNRTLVTEDLERLRLALTLLYINKGYLTSGAIIPDQDVTSGEITVQIIEGKLTRIDVEGNRWFRSSYLRDRLSLGIRTPVTLGPLQEQLQLLQQDRRIERVNAELRPGDTARRQPVERARGGPESISCHDGGQQLPDATGRRIPWGRHPRPRQPDRPRRPAQTQLWPVERRLSDGGRLVRPPLQPIRDDLFSVLPAHRLQTHRAALHSAEHQVQLGDHRHESPPSDL